MSEQSPGSYEDTTDDESEGEAMQLDSPAVANGTNGAHKPRAKLSAETQQRVAQLIAKLASRAQYAKVWDFSRIVVFTPFCRPHY